MVDFDIQRCSRRCAKSDQEFAPGEVFYSVLIAKGSEIVRYDYSEAAWEGPPDEAIGWWRSQMPEPTARRANWAPNDVMLDYFQQLESQAEKQDVRYILTLLMIRRRVLRLEDSEFDEQGHESMVVFCPRNDTEYHVPVVSPDAARAREIQDELARLLLSDAV
ncbi:MAG: hypothetical protein EA424_26575 [Planctomycetaceae bacterium]|nr:MAG: hypothetical protein EA424_26575 [Planctomycetaceae bacterium]